MVMHWSQSGYKWYTWNLVEMIRGETLSVRATLLETKGESS
jgi:hypothetical protein